MLDFDAPEDFVIATGETHTPEGVRPATFARVELNWLDHVVESSALHRSMDIMYSSGDPSKAGRLQLEGREEDGVVTLLRS